MNERVDPTNFSDALDELVTQLLECGGVLSQIISQMVKFEAAGNSAPSAAPIPEVAHSLIRDALDDMRKRHSKSDIRTAAAIIGDATQAIIDGIFFVGPELN